MRHIHTSIVSRYLLARGNNKILRTTPPHINSSEKIRLTRQPLPNSEQINHPSSYHTCTKSTPNHIHHYYAPSVTPTHMTHINLQLHPHFHHVVNPELVGRSRLSDGTVGQMDGEAGWWTSSKKIRHPHYQEWVDNMYLVGYKIQSNGEFLAWLMDYYIQLIIVTNKYYVTNNL